MSASTALTKGIYHLTISRQYFESFKNDCKKEAKKDANWWLHNLTMVENSVVRSMTPESRELYQEEIKEGDVLFFPNISEMILRMTPEQRDTVERICDALLKGEMIEVS